MTVKPVLVSFVFGAVVVLAGCPQDAARPDVVCSDVCKKRIVGCTPHECERGCAFVMDRLVEHEQETVLHCVETSQHCTDREWADCATRVGAHVDGGPGVPPSLPAEY